MQLTTTTDYGTKIICYLAQNKGMVSATILSSKLGIPMNYIFKVTKLLKSANLIQSIDGQKGGYALAKAANEITVLDITMATEKTMHLIHCLGDDKYCSSDEKNIVKFDCSMKSWNP